MEFINFLLQAKINTYATAGEGGEIRRDNSCKDLTFKQNGFKYIDRYFGSNPFIGEETVWQDNKIIWGMNYYGIVLSKVIAAKKVYQFLKLAMQRIDKKHPFRGPDHFQKDEFEYLNNTKGDINFFHGEESIQYKKQEVYRLYYHGGKM